MMNQTCKACAYGFTHEEQQDTFMPGTYPRLVTVSVYRCHRYAPRATDERWPKVDFSEWCGEFVVRCGLDEAV